MSVHEHRHRRARAVIANPMEERAMSTIVSVVYVTQSPTFTGAVAGYTTLGVAIDTPEPTATASSSDATTSTTAAAVDQATSANSASSSAKTTLQTSKSTGMPSAITSSPTTLSSSIGIFAATGGLSSSTSSSVAAATDSASSGSTGSSSSSSGMSIGGKAGLAIGILLLIGAILSLVLFCFKKRREATEAEVFENEKHEFSNIDRRASVQTTATSATAPRLSIRRHTQFLPNLTVKRASRGNALLTVTENGQKWDVGTDRPNTATSQSNNHENPFGNHAETISPIDETNAKGPEVVQDMAVGGEMLAGGAIAAAAPEPAANNFPLQRGASKRGNAPSPLDFTRSGPFMGPPSPAGTDFSMSSDSGAPVQTGTAVAIAAAGGPASSAVHRVQLDFKPSMEDELELRAGQLIRLLHEYDDGWALCIRLDRSRQGVVPRTCLSTRPVKPRPQQNGPRTGSPGMRGPPVVPAGLASSPRSVPLPASPQLSMTSTGRPMTPTGPLPSTPTNQGRIRSPSVAQSTPSSQNSMQSGPLYPQFPPTPVGRKPVPGQAL